MDAQTAEPQWRSGRRNDEWTRRQRSLNGEADDGMVKGKMSQLNNEEDPAVALTVENRQRSLLVTAQTRDLLLRVAAQCHAAMRFPHQVQVHVLLVGHDRIRALNREYRGKNTVTDVLSFPALVFAQACPILQPGDLDPATGRVFLGDLVICIPRMREQAVTYGHGETRELAFLMAHGMLHLMGLDHETEPEEKHMFGLQERVLSALGLTRTGDRE